MSRAAYLEETRVQARANVADFLAEHRVIEEGEGRWYFGAPKTGIHAMRVIQAPGCLFVYGDCGEIAFLAKGADGMGWVKGVVSRDNYDAGYLAEKVPPNFSFRKFEPKLIEQHRQELLETAEEYAGYEDESDGKWSAKYRELADKIKAYPGGFESPHEYYLFLRDHYELVEIDELPEVEALNYSFFFLVEALRVFFDRLPNAVRRAA